jgi:outer membrane protein
VRANFISWMVGTLVVLFVVSAAAQEPAALPKVVRIGVVTDGPSEAYNKVAYEKIRHELLELTRTELDVRMDPDKLVRADWTVDGARRSVDSLFADEQVDLILALGVLATNDLLGRTSLPKPCVAPLVVAPKLQGVEGPDGMLRRPNLSYVVWKVDFERDLRAFRELGAFKRIAFLASGPAVRAVPKITDRIAAAASSLGIEAEVVIVENSATAALEAIPSNVDAVYVMPNPQLKLADLDALAAGLTEKRLPSFAWMGRRAVERGFLAGLGTQEDMDRFARRVALNMQAMLIGEDPGPVGAAFQLSEQLSLNMATARAIGVWPSWGVITEAVLINKEKEQVGRHLSLDIAVRDAMRTNLSYAAARRAVDAGSQDVRRARSNLLPRLTVSADGQWIDKDRAGTQAAERTLSWSGTLSQSIFNDAAWGNLTIQERLQRARELQLESTRLDLVRDVAVGYLTLLKAQTIEHIQQENLALSRKNLALARLRRQIGTARPNEVFRWESQIAQARRDVIAAASARNQAEINLNRLLNRPLEESFVTKEASLDDTYLLSGHEAFRSFLGNPFRFKVLREFMVKEGLEASPDLGAIRSQIAAKKRNISVNRRSLYLPTLGAQAGLTHKFLKGGEGSDPQPLPAPFDEAFTTPNSVDWYVGVSASLPLFEGGARYADISKSELELARLDLLRRAQEQAIEARIRSSLHAAGASFPAIGLTRDAANAAKGNLDVVAESYANGTSSILNLLDAQNQALVADLSAASAVHDFLIDLMELERAAGRYTFFRSDQEVRQFFTRLEAFSNARAQSQGVLYAPSAGGAQ